MAGDTVVAAATAAATPPPATATVETASSLELGVF